MGFGTVTGNLGHPRLATPLLGQDLAPVATNGVEEAAVMG